METNQTLGDLFSFLQDTLRGTVAVLAGMLETVSPSLGIHCKRVAGLARRLGEEPNDRARLRAAI